MFDVLDMVFGKSGSKIKVIAAISFVIQVIGGFLAAAGTFIAIVVDLDGFVSDFGPFALLFPLFAPILIFIVTIIVAYIDSLFLYAFGEIVDAACVYLFKANNRVTPQPEGEKPLFRDEKPLFNKNKKETYIKINGQKAPVTPDGALLCPHCWKKLPTQDASVCPNCGKSL